MAKRKNSLDLKCPGCQVKFDSKIHVPFLGTCFHSLCGVCVNEKHVKACRVCGKDGAFASKQRNDLALELLKAMAENEIIGSNIPKFDAGEETYSNQLIPAVLASKNRPFLANIVNQLDPASFLKLSSTCKYLHHYCFHSKDIKIEYEISHMSVGSQNGVFGFTLLSESENWSYRYRPSNYVGYGCGFLGSMLNRKKLRDYPIVFKIRDLMFEADMDMEFLAKTLTFFAEFPIQSISRITVSGNIIHWNSFIQLLKDFHIGDVRMYIPPPLTIPDETVMYLLQNTTNLHSNCCISEKLLCNASVPNLDLWETVITKNTFLNLVLKFANSTDDIDWNMCYNEPFGHYDLFRSLPVYYKGLLPEERPLAFVIDEHPKIFWILRKDGKYLRCWSSNNIEFLTTRDRNIPNELIHWDDDYSTDLDDFDPHMDNFA